MPTYTYNIVNVVATAIFDRNLDLSAIMNSAKADIYPNPLTSPHPQVVILIVIPFGWFIGSPHLFGFTSVIWGGSRGDQRSPRSLSSGSKNTMIKKQ